MAFIQVSSRTAAFPVKESLPLSCETAEAVGWVGICSMYAKEEESELDLYVKGPGSGQDVH